MKHGLIAFQGCVALLGTAALLANAVQRANAAPAERPAAVVPRLPLTRVGVPRLPLTRMANAGRLLHRGTDPSEDTTRSRVQRALDILRPHVGRLSRSDALATAFRAYFRYQAAHPERVRKPYLYFVDYGLSSESRRGYVFDMSTLRMVEGPFMVAHGRGSDPGRSGTPTRFSNRPGSQATALGLYVAENEYSFLGHSEGYSYRSLGLRLQGLSGAFNSRAFDRGVVLHGAPYVNAGGRSEGCPAVEQSLARRLVPLLAHGALVFLYSPHDREWLSSDPWAAAGTADTAGEAASL